MAVRKQMVSHSLKSRSAIRIWLDRNSVTKPDICQLLRVHINERYCLVGFHHTDLDTASGAGLSTIDGVPGADNSKVNVS